MASGLVYELRFCVIYLLLSVHYFNKLHSTWVQTVIIIIVTPRVFYVELYQLYTRTSVLQMLKLLKPCVSNIINGKLVGNLFIFASVRSSFVLMSENIDGKKKVKIVKIKNERDTWQLTDRTAQCYLYIMKSKWRLSIL